MELGWKGYISFSLPAGSYYFWMELSVFSSFKFVSLLPKLSICGFFFENRILVEPILRLKSR